MRTRLRQRTTNGTRQPLPGLSGLATGLLAQGTRTDRRTQAGVCRGGGTFASGAVRGC